MKAKVQAIRKRRDDALDEAGRVYRRALESLTERMQEARRVYDQAAFDAQERWSKELADLNDAEQPQGPER